MQRRFRLGATCGKELAQTPVTLPTQTTAILLDFRVEIIRRNNPSLGGRLFCEPDGHCFTGGSERADVLLRVAKRRNVTRAAEHAKRNREKADRDNASERGIYRRRYSAS